MLLRPSSLGMSLSLSRKLSHCHTLHITLTESWAAWSEPGQTIGVALVTRPRQEPATPGILWWNYICTLDGNTAFYFQAALLLPTKECWSVWDCYLLTNDARFKCPLHILQTDMGILCCGISSFINIGSAPLASINQTQYDPFLPSTKNMSGYKYNMALTRDLMMCNSSLRQSESNASSQLSNMLLVYWP